MQVGAGSGQGDAEMSGQFPNQGASWDPNADGGSPVPGGQGIRNPQGKYQREGPRPEAIGKLPGQGSFDSRQLSGLIQSGRHERELARAGAVLDLEQTLQGAGIS